MDTAGDQPLLDPRSLPAVQEVKETASAAKTRTAKTRLDRAAFCGTGLDAGIILDVGRT